MPSPTTIAPAYQVLAYHLPRTPPTTLLNCTISLTPSSWSVDLHNAFPTGTPTDIHILRPAYIPFPCFCGQQEQFNDISGDWDQNWLCTAVCKLKRRYKEYVCVEETRAVGYALFVEADEYDGAEDVPLLERSCDFEAGVPIWLRGMVMVRVEEWVPVDVRPGGDGLKGVEFGGDDMVHLKRFLKFICSDESAWEGRFPKAEAKDVGDICELELESSAVLGA